MVSKGLSAVDSPAYIPPVQVTVTSTKVEVRTSLTIQPLLPVSKSASSYIDSAFPTGREDRERHEEREAFQKAHIYKDEHAKRKGDFSFFFFCFSYLKQCFI